MSTRAASLRAAWGLAALLLSLSLAWPWHGWQGLRTPAPAVAVAALIIAGIAVLARPAVATVATVATVAAVAAVAALAAVLAGLCAAVLFIARLLSPPANPFLHAWQSRTALALGAAASLAIVAVGATALRGSQRRRSTLSWSLDSGVVWRAFWSSRLLAWAAGVAGVQVLGVSSAIGTVPRIDAPFGRFLDHLIAPASAWDATSYLTISQYGYGHGRQFLAFFPAYPSLLRAAGFSAKADVLFGVLVSLAAFAGALYLLLRLVELECGRERAELTVLLVAFSPMALFFSAVYTESLFLALSVASLLCARRGRWAAAGALGGLAAATRSTGVALLVPLLIMFAHPPAPADRAPERRELLWLLLVPAGAALFFAYAGFNGDLLEPLRAQHTYWQRSFTPLLGAWRGTTDALHGKHLVDFAFLALALFATVGALRRLPLAYGAYALAMVALTTSSYTPSEPLASFPRYLVVVFPCQMWLAAWCSSKRWRRHAALLLGGVLMALFAARFASWRWVA